MSRVQLLISSRMSTASPLCCPMMFTSFAVFSFIIGIKESRILKWNAGVRRRRCRFHCPPVLWGVVKSFRVFAEKGEHQNTQTWWAIRCRAMVESSHTDRTCWYSPDWWWAAPPFPSGTDWRTASHQSEREWFLPHLRCEPRSFHSVTGWKLLFTGLTEHRWYFSEWQISWLTLFNADEMCHARVEVKQWGTDYPRHPSDQWRCGNLPMPVGNAKFCLYQQSQPPQKIRQSEENSNVDDSTESPVM